MATHKGLVAAHRGLVCLVMGAKGGAGKSVLAANLAFHLRRETRSAVLLADLDMTFCGDACLSLGVDRAKRSLSDLAPIMDNILPSMFKSSLHKHESGVNLLPAYHNPADFEWMRPSLVKKMLSVAKGAFDIVVVDLGTGLGPTHLAALEAADHVLAVLTPDMLGMRQTRQLLDTLRGMGVPQQMVSVVLNKVPVRSRSQESLVAAKLGRSLLASVPDAMDLFSECAAQGKVLAQVSPRHAASRALAALATDLLTSGAVHHPFKLKTSSGPGEPGEAVSEPGEGEPYVFTAGKMRRKPDPLRGKIEALKLRIHQRLLEEIDLKRLDTETAGDSEKARRLRLDTKRVVDRLLDQEGQDIKDRTMRLRIANDILDEALGLGPLEKLLEDDGVTEIMCNGAREIFVERGGKLELTDLTFLSENHMGAIIDRIVSPLGRRIDELKPMVDARLPDGSRVNAIIPPLSLGGPLLTIRKFSRRPMTVDDLINYGSLNRNIAELLRCCVQARLNVLVSGGTGSGKTTLLNVLASFIPDSERIITIEDSAELQLPQSNVCRLESRPKSLEGTGEITIRDLVVNALRMRPDRIVVGECRHTEALDMLQAMNTGHDGSLTTIHANSPRDSLSRLETLVMFAGTDLPSRAVREQIAAGIDIVVQQKRLSDGTRRIVEISEVVGLDEGQIEIQDIFEFREGPADKDGKSTGHFMPTGYIPQFMTTMQNQRFPVTHKIFMPEYSMGRSA